MADSVGCTLLASHRSPEMETPNNIPPVGLDEAVLHRAVYREHTLALLHDRLDQLPAPSQVPDLEIGQWGVGETEIQLHSNRTCSKCRDPQPAPG